VQRLELERLVLVVKAAALTAHWRVAKQLAPQKAKI